MSIPKEKRMPSRNESSDAENMKQEGYERPLFEENSPKWSDDRIMGGSGEQIEVRYHDKDMVLKVANGLCYDIFFRADDVFRPDFDIIPEFFAPVAEGEKKLTAAKPDQKKPLDSKNRNRTYLLNPEEKEEQSPKKRAGQSRTRKSPSARTRTQPRAQSSSGRRRRR